MADNNEKQYKWLCGGTWVWTFEQQVQLRTLVAEVILHIWKTQQHSPEHNKGKKSGT